MTRRLLIISRCHEPRGGADRIVADLCEGLPSHGWDVRLGLTVGARFNRPEPYRTLYPGLPVVEIDGTLGTRSARLRAIRQVIDAERPDAVLSMRVFDALEAVATSRPRPRMVYGVRALEHAYLDDVRRFGSAIDLCVTSGNLIAALCVRFAGMSPLQVASIGGGVAPPRSAVAPRAHRGGVLRLLYAGRLEAHQKRVLDIPGVLAALERDGLEFEMDIVGAGPAEDELAERLGPRVASGQVRLHGWQSRDALYEVFYPRADVLLHTAAWEGITIAPREAMVHGVVPVISEFPGARAEGIYVHEKTALTFAVGDCQAAARAIARLHREPGLLERLSRAAMDSQRGDRSQSGAIEAWARALDASMERPGSTAHVSAVPDPVDGRLQRLGVPAAAQSWLRRLLGRPVRHSDPGSEWPTSSGQLDADARSEIDRLQRTLDVAGCFP